MSTTKRRFGIRVFVLWFVTLWIIAARPRVSKQRQDDANGLHG